MYKHLNSEQRYTISVILQNGMNRKDSHLIVESTYFLLDLERSFDTMSHGKLIEVLSRTIWEGRVASPIHIYIFEAVCDGKRIVRGEQERHAARQLFRKRC